MRLVMKPGDSLITTVSFFIRRPTPTAVAIVSASVSMAFTISISFILWTGLKKCMPMHFAGRDVMDAISVMLSDDVFEARIAVGREDLSAKVKISIFDFISSGT